MNKAHKNISVCARINQTYGHCHGDRRTCDHPCYAVQKFKQPTCWQKSQLKKERTNDG